MSGQQQQSPDADEFVVADFGAVLLPRILQQQCRVRRTGLHRAGAADAPRFIRYDTKDAPDLLGELVIR
jgi:hypothetical protein